jgi:hypothetical protein
MLGRKRIDKLKIRQRAGGTMRPLFGIRPSLGIAFSNSPML